MDGFFHINQAILITGNLPFETILTSLTLKLLYIFFGQYYILYRLFNLFLFLISYFFIFTLVKNSFRTPFLRLMFACFIVLSIPMNFNILGYDSLSIFSISICIWFLLKYNIEKTFNFIVFAFFVAISGLIRLPNLVILLWICLFFLDYRKVRMQNWKTLFYLYCKIGVFSILFYLGFLIIHYSSIHNITHSFASNRHHNVIKLLLRYFSDLSQISYYLLGFIFLYFFSKIKKPRFLFFIALFVFFKFLYKSHINYHIEHWQYSFVFSAFIFSLIIIDAVGTKSIRSKHLFYLFSISIVCIGADTGLLKMAFPNPLILLLFVEIFNSNNRRYLYGCLIVLLPLSIIESFTTTYGDAGYPQLRKVFNQKSLYPIRTNEKNYHFVNAVIDVSNKLENEGYKVFYYGQGAMLYDFLRPNPRSIYTYHQPLDQLDEMNSILQQNKNNKIAIILFKFSTSKLTNVEQLLLNNGFKVYDSSYIFIYVNDSIVKK